MIGMRINEAAELVNGQVLGDDCAFEGVSTDTRRVADGELFVALRGENHDAHEFMASAAASGAVAAMVSERENLVLPLILVDDTRLALGKLAAGWRKRFTGTMIGLTGSNGKTTVKEMIASIQRGRGSVHATRGNLNNDIGMPLTLLELSLNTDFAVIEMGANHPAEIDYLSQISRPDVALITNAGPAHLEGFGDLDGVARAKGEIYTGLSDTGTAIVNADDRYADYWRKVIADRSALSFGMRETADVGGRMLPGAGKFELNIKGEKISVSLPVGGEHNVMNALAAAAACYATGATLRKIADGLESVKNVDGRLQKLAGRFGSTLIDDSYNANPASLAAALETIGRENGPKWLVLGDMYELGEQAQDLHRVAGMNARSAHFEKLYCLGELSHQAAGTFGPGATAFETVEDLIETLSHNLERLDQPCTILVKGSRGMRMERVVSALSLTRGLSPEAH